MTKGLNIVSRLTFENIPDGTLPTSIPDENQYSNYSYTKSTGTITIETIDGIKFIKLNSVTAKIYSPFIITDQSNKNFQAEFDVIFDTLKVDTHLVSIGTSVLTNALRVVASNNPAQGLRLINGNNQISSYYKFENNKKYTICVGFKDKVISMYVDGTIIGYFYSEEFINSLNVTTPSNIILGAPLNNTNDINATLYGKLGNINISSGPSVKHEESYTKYGTNLVSFLNFENLAGIGTYKTGVEAVYEGIEWRGVESTTYSNGYGNIKNISTNLTGEFTVTFSLKKINNASANILKYGIYSVDFVAGFIPVPEPDVEVNEYTTSALNFENGLIDQVGTTVWNKSGTANVTSVNKIFGESSFETKALGDGLSTTSTLITGGATPYTIEFYALIKSDNLQTLSGFHPILTSKHLNGIGGGSQGLYLNKTTNQFMYQRTTDVEPNFGVSGNLNFNNNKIAYNEINKITITFDGVALRFFINDVLDYIIGTLNGHYTRTFFHLYSHPAAFDNTTKGLIDNVNIHDGIATKVRDYDPYEEFLVVDLAFDGENNSTKIVDNGTLKSTWTGNGNVKLSTTQKFDGFSSLYVPDSTSTINKNDEIILDRDFTISFDIIFNTTNFSDHNYIAWVDSNNKNEIYYIGIYKSSYPYPHLATKFLFTRDDWYGASTAPIQGTPDHLISTTTPISNKKYNIVVIKKDDLLYMYINGVLESTSTSTISYKFKNLVLNYRVSDPYYIKNFKIYNGVAVIPEDPTGKIQLDFDNNLVDKYGNSTWTNNGVTFDQVNSVKGYAIKLSNTSTLNISNNQNLDFGNGNFYINADLKNLESSNSSIYRYWLTTQTAPESVGSVWFASRNESIGIDYNPRPANYNGMSINNCVPNTYYNHTVIRKNNVILNIVNDTICNTSILDNTIFNLSNCSIGGSAPFQSSNRTSMNGYIDNFKSIKNYQEPVIIDRPAVHLPLETNVISTGFIPLTINSVGNPTYTTIDGKKCIKFESGKYLTINSNNIFNLGANSDFYIEFDFYPTNISKIFCLIDNFKSSTNNTWLLAFNPTKGIYLYQVGKTDETTNLNPIINSWNKLIFKRYNTNILITLNNDAYIISNTNLFSDTNTNIAAQVNVRNSSYDFEGYMSNFKMFVGTSEIPETYNDKKVLDLDFKPTRKSYLFKDNNNKFVIHPVNITHRDYQDSQYCCTFNGTDQYLQLGKNDLLNFGNDDFVINIKFKFNKRGNNNPLMASGHTTNTAGYWYIQIRGETSATDPMMVEFVYRIDGSNVYTIRCNQTLIEDVIYEFTLIRDGVSMKAYLSGELNYTVTDERQPTSFNLNGGDNTYIGVNRYDPYNWIFKGSIYSIKVLRNTTDLSLLEDESSNVIVGDTTLTLSNGTDSQELIFDNKNQNDFRFIHSEDSVRLIANEEILEVPSAENELSHLSLFTDFNAEAKDIKTYNIAFEGEDSFSGNIPIHTQFGEIEEISTLSDDFIVVDQGDFIVKGFFEGRPENSRYQIQNRFDKFIVHTGSGPFNYNGLNERFIDDYEIYLPDTKETMPIPTEMMERGYITISITPTECEGINFAVKVFRRNDNKLIGIYDFNNYVCTIDNLDCNKRYDCIIFDRDVNLESRSLSNRTPLPY